ncbi:MAG: phosphate acyltransferase PlsX [Armatimonadetes bacterium]|nr:phosphate acyltransferase PlsX [Armatimonadota bacterium]
MKIAVDAMGGDHAPAEIVKGAAGAIALYDVEIALVGDEQAIAAHLPKHLSSDRRIQIRHTPDSIAMEDSVNCVRTKPKASVVVAADMVKSGEADALITLGNTAAAMAVAALKLGRVPGIERPAIATILPSLKSGTILLDAGATADCTPDNLLQFAVMGSIYAERVMKKTNPRVALLSIGEEPSKGNELTKATHQILRSAGLNFIGNVEGKDMFSGAADVIVADGFVGNVALKASEGLGEFVMELLKEELGRHKLTRIPLFFLLPSISRLKKRVDYTEYGGAPLLGVNGICIIGHGRSNAKAVISAIRIAKEAVDRDIIDCIKTSLPSPDSIAAGS